MATKTFPNPKRPYSLKGIVKKIIADPDYAKFIHNEVRKAREGDRAAAACLAANFGPLESELKALNIPGRHRKGILCCSACTKVKIEARAHLIDFAAYVRK
jgi:hypothetical protein